MKKIIIILMFLTLLTFNTVNALVMGDTNGYTDSYLAIEDKIYGVAGGPTSTDGTANFIKAKIVTNPDYSGSVSCALYEYVANNDAGVLIGNTEEKTIGGSQDAWFQFNFSSPPPVANNKKYYICISAEASDGACYIEYNVDLESEGLSKSNTYEYPWDNPITGETDVAYTLSLYCNYTVNISSPSGNDNITLSALNPSNNSHINSAPQLFFNITNVTTDYNYYVYIGEPTSSLLYSGTLNSNDSFYGGNYSNASTVGTTYYWRVQVNNSTVGFNRTFDFVITSGNKGQIISSPDFTLLPLLVGVCYVVYVFGKNRKH